MLKKLIYLNIVLAIVLNWFSSNPSVILYGLSYLDILPKQIFGIVEFISIIIFIQSFKLIKKNKIVVYSLFTLLLYILFYISYTILWGGSIFNVLMGVRNYLSFIPIFFGGYYLAYYSYSIKPYLILILILCLVQIPVTIVQFIVSPALLSRGTAYDAVAGTMGGLNTNVLAILLVSVIIVLFTLYVRFKHKKYLVFASLLFVPPILGDAKGIFVLLMLGLSLIFLLGKISMKRKLAFLFVSVFMFTILSILYINLITEDSRRVLDPEFYLEYEMSKKNREGPNVRLSRIQSVGYATELVSNNLFSLTLGYGLGNASRNNLYGADGEYFSSTTIIHFWDKTITELGMVGSWLIVIIMLYVFFRLRKIVKFFLTMDPLLSALADGLSVVVLIIILSGFYTDHISKVQIMYPLALVLGFIFSKYRIYKYRYKSF